MAAGNSRYQQIAAALCIVLVIASCSDGSKKETPTQGLPDPGSDIPPVTSISTTPEPVSSNTISIDSSGGEIQATSSAGVQYKLAVGSDALDNPVDISITPVTSISGLHFADRLLAAVQFEPDGLRLARPAVLTVTLPADVDLSRLVGFSWSGSGERIQLEPVAPPAQQLTFLVHHFSGTGVAEGDVSTAAQALEEQTAIEAKFKQEMALAAERIAKEIRSEAESSACGATCDFGSSEGTDKFTAEYQAAMVAILAQWIDRIDPQSGLPPGISDLGDFATEYFTWEYTAVTALCGIEGDGISDGEDPGVEECPLFLDNFDVRRDLARLSLVELFLADFAGALAACDDNHTAARLRDAALVAGKHPRTLREHFLSLMELDDSPTIDLQTELRRRYACHLVIEAENFPEVIGKGAPPVEIAVKLTNQKSPSGAPLSDVTVNFETHCAHINGAATLQANTDTSGRISNLLFSAFGDCFETPTDQAILTIKVDDNTDPGLPPEEFFLGRTLILSAATQTVEPIVSLTDPRSSALAEYSSTGGFSDNDSSICSDPTCTAGSSVSDSLSVNGFSTSISCQANTASTFNAGLDSTTLSVSGSGHSNIQVSVATDSSGAVQTGCISTYGTNVITEQPLKIDVAGSVDSSGAAFASISIREVSSSTDIMNGRADGFGGSVAPMPFSAIVPPGNYRIDLNATARGDVVCEGPGFCDGDRSINASFAVEVIFSIPPP